MIAYQCGLQNPMSPLSKKLAKRHLLALISSGFDDTLFDVQFFAQGIFNKLYRVCYESHPITYMFRVSLSLSIPSSRLKAKLRHWHSYALEC